MLPAVGQGAIAVETRSDDEFAIAALRKLDHALRESPVWPNVRCFVVLVAVVSFQSRHMEFSLQNNYDSTRWSRHPTAQEY
jgi:hypothetical protein